MLFEAGFYITSLLTIVTADGWLSQLSLKARDAEVSPSSTSLIHSNNHLNTTVTNADKNKFAYLLPVNIILRPLLDRIRH